MSVQSLRPDTTVSNNGVTVTGAANAAAALADDSDASYISAIDAGDSVTVSFGDVSVPAGAVLQTLAIRLRVSAPSSAATGLEFKISMPGWGSLSRVVSVIGSVVYTFTALPTSTFAATPAVLQAMFNGLTLKLDSPTDDDKGGSVAFAGKVYEAYADVGYAVPPVVDVTGPSGTVLDTTTPTITWDETLDSIAGGQATFEVRIFNAAQFGAGGFDPGSSPAYEETDGLVSGGEQEWTVPESLANDTYRAYVRVGQNQLVMPTLSAWDFIQWTQDVEAPPAPTITATGDNSNARIRIDVDANAGVATTDQFELQRSVDGGATWEEVRTLLGDGILSVEDNAAYDYETGNGQIAIYRARAGHLYSNVVAYSDWATSSAASWVNGVWWLKSPTNPELNAIIFVHSLPSYQSTARQGFFQPLGAANPVGVSDTRGGDTGTIVLRLDTQAQQDALDALLDTNTPLLLQGAQGEHWKDRYVLLGTQGRARVADKSWFEAVFDTYIWTEVDSPALPVGAWPNVVLPSETLYPSTSLYPG